MRRRRRCSREREGGIESAAPQEPLRSDIDKIHMATTPIPVHALWIVLCTPSPTIFHQECITLRPTATIVLDTLSFTTDIAKKFAKRTERRQ
eukprot:gene11020-biopygen281